MDCLRRWQSTYTCHYPNRFSLLQVKNGLGSPDLHVSMDDIHTVKNSHGCTALHMLGWREMTEACVSEDLKCWAAWDTTCGHKAKNITPSVAWRREVWTEEALDDLPWKDERRPLSTRQTLALFQRQHPGNLWEMGWSAYGLFQVHINHFELNWTKQSSELHDCQEHTSTACFSVEESGWAEKMATSEH